jgi:isoquinoline 1-oxidoreductase
MRNDLPLDELLARPDSGAEDQLTFEMEAAAQELSRRSFAKMILGAGLLITVSAMGEEPDDPPPRRGRGGGGGGATNVAARVHIGKDGVITVLTGKVEVGQGSRAELTQAAAEELRVPVSAIQLVMADTDLVPNDGITAGSGSTPRTLPDIRRGAAGARDVLLQLASKKWGVEKNTIETREGKLIHGESKREVSYGDIASEDTTKAFEQAVPNGVSVTAVKEWKVLGQPIARPNARDLVTGKHSYPSDIQRPGMLYGKVLRPPSFGATLKSLDTAAAKAMKDVTVVQDGSFVGVVAPTSFAAQTALDALAKTAQWEGGGNSPSSRELYDHLRNRAQGNLKNPSADEVGKAAKSVRATYHVAYVQHTPMEPRAAVAEWNGKKLTVWVGTQNPFGAKSQLMQTFGLGNADVRVIVPDTGGGFGGKHSPTADIEAARLAKGAGKPVSLRWTRAEEFTWAFFRPAGVIDAEASLDANGKLTSWHFVNINSGGSAVASPYSVAKSKSDFVRSSGVLKESSYRGLAATANTFARECMMDELATAAGRDPLEFRLAHLPEGRLRAVLELAAKKFDWVNRVKKKDPNVGVGLACGTEKGSYTAACVEVAIKDNEIAVRHVCQAFECGAIINPGNLRSQVEGAIIMGIGPALREETTFEKGRITNATFNEYLVPRFRDVPELDIQLLDRPDLQSAGAGETPIIAVAPGIANAVFHATGKRIRQMPIRLDAAQ